MKVLGWAANHSTLWLGAAALLASRQGPTRRAAMRGVLTVAGASAATNLLGKPLLPRRRPATHLLPRRRRYSAPPRSSSFPSGHAASAVAFTAAVAVDSPAAGAALAPLAAAVAYSRVHTGVHWPSDVFFGGCVGLGMALAGRYWWPPQPETPTAVGRPVDAPELPEGEGLLVLINPESGDGTADPHEWVATHWPAAKTLEPEEGGDLAADLEATLDREGASVRALGVAGGDGTVSAVAVVATRRELPLAVLPSGTLNHFARAVGLEEPSGLRRAVEAGTAVRVDLGTVTIDGAQTQWFLNTASLGGYPDMVRLREEWEPRWGKWAAATAALVRVLHSASPLPLIVDGRRRDVWVLFVGNGSYAPRGFAPVRRRSLESGSLDVRYVRADARFSRLRFLASALTGTLRRSHTYLQVDRGALQVSIPGTTTPVATDGEVGRGGTEFRFAAHSQVLTVYRPES